MVEIYIFYEMADAGASKSPPFSIQILDFEGTPAYQVVEPRASRSSWHDWPLVRGAPPAEQQQLRFDVRACRCMSMEDEARMLAVIESTGAGLNTFNTVRRCRRARRR